MYPDGAALIRSLSPDSDVHKVFIATDTGVTYAFRVPFSYTRVLKWDTCLSLVVLGANGTLVSWDSADVLKVWQVSGGSLVKLGGTVILILSARVRQVGRLHLGGVGCRRE